MTAPDGSGIPDSRSTPQTAGQASGPAWVEKISIKCSTGECGLCKWPLCSCPCHEPDAPAAPAPAFVPVEALKTLTLAWREKAGELDRARASVVAYQIAASDLDEAIAAAAPAVPLADPGDLAEQWFDGTHEDCSLTARAAGLDGFRAGWEARAAAAPAGTTGEAGCGKCSHPQADHAFRGEPDVCAWRECKCPSYRDPQPQAAPGLAAIDDDLRAAIERVIDRYPDEQAAPELAAAALRDGIESLIEDLEQSAKATAPSKKSAIEETVAERLGILLAASAGQPERAASAHDETEGA